jgi:hypothetical protein
VNGFFRSYTTRTDLVGRLLLGGRPTFTFIRASEQKESEQ